MEAKMEATLEQMVEASRAKEGERVTVRQLRKILFELRDQQMTVKEVRTMLFEADVDQNAYAMKTLREGSK